MRYASVFSRPLPIEGTRSSIKTVLRQNRYTRIRKALQEALEYALTTVSASNALGWFRHCGYLTAPQEAM